VVRLLLDKGALLDEKNRWGRTALMHASDNGHTEVVRLLLDITRARWSTRRTRRATLR